MTRVTVKTSEAFISFVVCVALVLCGALSSQAEDTFALVGEKNGSLDKLDVTTGTHAQLAHITGVYSGLAFNADQTTIFGIVSPSLGAQTQLVTIDPVTGANTAVGNDGVALSTLTNLSDGRLFGVGFDSALYQINPTSGVATLIGPTGLPALSITYANSLASNGTTLYYTFQTSGFVSSLYTLNTATGSATLVGPTTGAFSIAGSAFAGHTFSNGQLYAFDAGGSTFTINLSNGSATLLNSNGLNDIFGGIGIINVVPEPASAMLVLTSGAALCMWGRGRRRNFT